MRFVPPFFFSRPRGLVVGVVVSGGGGGGDVVWQMCFG